MLLDMLDTSPVGSGVHVSSLPCLRPCVAAFIQRLTLSPPTSLLFLPPQDDETREVLSRFEKKKKKRKREKLGDVPDQTG